MCLACREALALWYLAGSWQEVQLNVGIGQTVGVHGLQSLQEKRRRCEGLGGLATQLSRALGAARGICLPLGPP